MFLNCISELVTTAAVYFIHQGVDGCLSLATAHCLPRCSFICHRTKKGWILNDFLWAFRSRFLKFSFSKERLIKYNISSMSRAKRDGTGPTSVKLKGILQF